MNSETRKKIIEEWAGNASQQEKIIILFEKVRDIPYGDIGSRDPQDVYEKNKGTCSGKHELLKELYQELGIGVKDFIAMHKFNDMEVAYPDGIKEILSQTEILDPHNFFKINIDGKWITVDCTWDVKSKELGFIVTENWDGKTDMKIAAVPVEIFETTDPIGDKKKRIAELPEDVQKVRKLFLSKMTEWLEGIRS